jgi:glycosyltransferase involved in cell wall biosynthesis
MGLDHALKGKRVLHLIGCREDTGGILSVLRNLRTITEPLGWDHVVWVHRSYREVRKPALVYRPTDHLFSEHDNHLRLLLGSIRAMPELARLLKDEPFDFLHGHSRGALLVMVMAARWWKRKTLFTNHAYARRIGLYRWAAKQPRVVTSVLSPNMARHYGFSTGPDGVEIVSESCADRYFSIPMRSSGPGSASDPIRLVGLGNILRWKNWHLILEALASLPPEWKNRVQFHHWGPTLDDPDSRAYAEELKQQVQRYNLNNTCYFHGLSLAIEETLKEASCFILPSTNEPCSVALIEALAMGVPCLASASGGNIDILKPEATGLLFEPENVNDLAHQIRRVAEGSVPFLPGSEVRESVRQRSATVVSQEYLRIYDTRMSG